MIAVLLLGVTPLAVQAGAEPPFDWQPWQSLATQDGGRVKPLDSLAWETLRLVANRRSLTDPDTGQKLDAVQSYSGAPLRLARMGSAAGESATADTVRPADTECRTTTSARTRATNGTACR